MVVLYCPVCGKKILLKAIEIDPEHFEFVHCGRHVIVEKVKEETPAISV